MNQTPRGVSPHWRRLGPFLFWLSNLPACPDRALIAPHARIPDENHPRRNARIRRSAASWCIASITNARTRYASAQIGGRTMCDCPTLSRCLSVRRAAKGLPMSD